MIYPPDWCDAIQNGLACDLLAGHEEVAHLDPVTREWWVKEENAPE